MQVPTCGLWRSPLLALVTLLAAALGPAPSAAAQSDGPVAGEVAMIEDLLRGGVRVEDGNAAPGELMLVPAGGGAGVAGKVGLGLSPGDELRTGEGIEVRVLYHADRAEVLVSASSSFVVVDRSSLRVRFGKVFATLSGFFTVLVGGKTLAVEGTELEIEASADERAELRVLDGVVAVGGPTAAQTSAAPLAASGGGSFWGVGVAAGGSRRVPATLVVSNPCGRARRFGVAGPRQLEWVRLDPAETLLGPGERGLLDVELSIDASRAPAGVYRDRLDTRCLDCGGNCQPPPQQLPLVIEVYPTQRVGGLRRATLDPGQAAPRIAAMDEPEVGRVLEWTDDVLVASQPSYAEEGELPSFPDPETRGRAFRRARHQAIWNRDSEARAVLGEVRADWGEGERSVAEFGRAAKERPNLTSSIGFRDGLARAYRLAGELDRSEELAAGVVSEDPRRTRARITLGNVYLDRATVSSEKGETGRAREYLEGSLGQYEQAHKTASRAEAEAIARSNTGLALTRQAEIERRQGQEQQAEELLQRAAREQLAARSRDPDYPFATVALGRVDQARANIARGRGDEAASRQLLDAAQGRYESALEAHGDLAAARYGLGTVWEDRGDRERALEEYERTVASRPTYSPVYYRMGELASETGQSSPYFERYLELIPEPYRETPKADRARSGSSGLPPVVPGPAKIRVPDLGGLDARTAQERLEQAGFSVGAVRYDERRRQKTEEVIKQSLAAGTEASRGDRIDLVVAVGKAIKMPELAGEGWAVAERRMRNSGLLVGQVTEEPSCETGRKVLSQDPPKDAKVRPGSRVDLVVATPGPGAPPVPPVVGYSQLEANRILAESGFGVGNVESEPSQQPEGTVLGQFPEPGAPHRRGCDVHITVAVPDLVRVPDLVGQSERDAIRVLSFSGLELGNLLPRQRSPQMLVAEQSLSPGSQVPRGSRIDLAFWLPPTPDPQQPPPRDPNDIWVYVPNLYCKSLDEAVEILRNVGLEPKWADQDDAVVRQSPASGRRVRRGSSVQLYLGDLCSCRVC